MTSATVTVETSEGPSAAFLFDAETLAGLAGEACYAAGLADYKARRVIDLEADSQALYGEVEDADSEEKLQLTVYLDSRGCLLNCCDCSTSDGSPELCRHAVALLCRHAAEGQDKLAVSARDVALKERLQKARSEVTVSHRSGELWFGRWEAITMQGASHYPRRYQVHMRTLGESGNYCDCPDFAVNTLGTCKHIEAVLHKIRKLPDYARFQQQTPPHSYVYLHWDECYGARIRLQWGASADQALRSQLGRYFDAEGYFQARMPEGFFELCRTLDGDARLDIGEDARHHVLRLASQTAQRRRAETIGQAVRDSGGRIPGLRARLYSYQVDGVAFLVANGRAMLADDMGLGKTLQTIAASVWLKQHESLGRVLVVCPASLKHQWAHEIERFTELSTQIVQGDVAARKAQYRRDADFHIINYELVMRDLSVINSLFSPDLLILDEAQRIKNWRTKTAAAIKRIDSRYAFVLSGTPLENRLDDLYSLMQVVDNRVLGPLWRYDIDFHVRDERRKLLGYRNLAQLRKRIAPVMLRRSRQLVADQLPDRLEKLLEVPMSQAQMDVHDDAMRAAGAVARIAKRRPLTPGEENRLMANLQRARMACDALGLVDGESEGAPKLDELSGLLEQYCLDGGQKMVVFSQWERMTGMAEASARKLGLGVVRLHGGVPSNKRGALLQRFAEDDGVQVFIATDAGATGLNLQSASVLVNLDIPWNPAVLDQRIARIHRLGQRRSVYIVNMLSYQGYEAQVYSLVGGKRQLFDNVIDPEATEDVVGVSKRALETVVEKLIANDPSQPTSDEPQTQEAPEPAAESSAPADVPGDEAGTEPGQDHEVAAAIQALQEHFGTRLEQVLGAGGGLLAVISHYEDNDEAAAEALARPDLPVAVIDRRAQAAMQRLGAASPLAGAVEHHATDNSVARNPLLEQAREKLTAAESLLQAGQQCAAAELLAASLRASAAARGGCRQVPAIGQTALWLYSEAVPKGWLNDKQAAAVLRAEGLALAEHVPEDLLAQILDDARVALACQ